MSNIEKLIKRVRKICRENKISRAEIDTMIDSIVDTRTYGKIDYENITDAHIKVAVMNWTQTRRK